MITADQARAIIAGYCGWHVAPVKTTACQLDSDGAPLVVLPTLRLLRIHEVRIAGEPVSGFQTSQSGMLRLRDVPPVGLGVVAVTMAHGYDDDVLAPLVTAMIEASKAPAGAKSQTAGPFSVSYDAGVTLAALTAEQRATLDTYRLGPRP